MIFEFKTRTIASINSEAFIDRQMDKITIDWNSVVRCIFTKKSKKIYLEQNPRKLSLFQTDKRIDGRTDRQAEICNHRIALLF